MNPMRLQTAMLVMMLLATIGGFLACLILYRFTKFPRIGARALALKCLYQWGAVFFAGCSLLSINWAMGQNAPLPIQPLDQEGGMAFPTLAFCWALICVAGFMMQRAWRVVHRPAATPEGRQLAAARLKHERDHHSPRGNLRIAN